MKRIFLLAGATALFSLPVSAATQLYFGADLSFANQMIDCGALFKDKGAVKDVYQIFKDRGANLIRIRIWTEGNKNNYSTIGDVERSIRSAKRDGMQVLLDFHYSDSWADAGKQPIPQAWADITDDKALADTLYSYTYYVLTTLDHEGLMPEMVQVGNEINPGIVIKPGPRGAKRDWARDAMIINAGIRAVRDAGAKSSIKPRILLQVAQPENVESWFVAATQVGVADYDIIGISYYGFQWSKEDLAQLGDTIRRLRTAYNKDVMVVETAYPWMLDPDGSHHSNLNASALLPGAPATPEGQRKFLMDLSHAVLAAGGDGVNYWAPDLVPNKCQVPYSNGSTTGLFDFEGNLLPGIDFLGVKP